MANEFKIKNGLLVSGSITGVTESGADNSAKMASTSWVRTYVSQNAGSISSTKTLQSFTATAGQTSFTITNGYTPGLLDIYLNGSFLNSSEYTATDGSAVVLTNAASVDDIVDVVKTSAFYVGTSPNARESYLYTATASQTTFAATYTPGQVDVFYNGAKLAPVEFTATNGTSVVLTTAATSGDVVEIMGWLTGGGLTGTRTLTINGTTYDLSANRSWTVTDATKLPLSGGTLTGALVGTSVTLSSSLTFTSLYGGSISGYDGTSLVPMKYTASQHQWYADGTLKMVLLGNGNLLLGTVGSDPGYRLDVNGTARVVGAATFSSSITVDGSGSSIRNGNELRFYRPDNAIYTRMYDAGSLGANGFVLDNMNAEGFHFKNNGVTIMRMPSNNYVGIGTTAPTERLHIAGPSNNVFLNEATSGNYAINRLKNSTYTVDFGLDANGMYLDGSTGSFRYFNGASQRFVIGSDGAMGFNYPVLGSRSFMFRALAGRVLAIEVAEAGGVHSLYLRPNASGRHLISSNYLSGGVYLPLALSARENDTDFVLATNGRIGIGTASPSGIVSIAFDQSSNNQFLNFIGTQSNFNQEYGFGIVNSTKDFRFYDYSAGKERFRITNAGDITYGVTAAFDTSIYWRQDFTGNIYARLWADGNPRFNIQVFGSGGVYLAAGGTSWTAASDERLKTDLLPIEDATSKVIQLRTMIGRYKTDEDSKRRSFLIAQDVQAVLPEAVDVDQKTGMMGVQYTEVIPLLVASIKELKAENDQLKDILTRNNIN